MEKTQKRVKNGFYGSTLKQGGNSGSAAKPDGQMIRHDANETNDLSASLHQNEIIPIFIISCCLVQPFRGRAYHLKETLSEPLDYEVQDGDDDSQANN